jgi:hypothetical protein
MVVGVILPVPPRMFLLRRLAPVPTMLAFLRVFFFRGSFSCLFCGSVLAFVSVVGAAVDV